MDKAKGAGWLVLFSFRRCLAGSLAANQCPRCFWGLAKGSFRAILHSAHRILVNANLSDSSFWQPVARPRPRADSQGPLSMNGREWEETLANLQRQQNKRSGSSNNNRRGRGKFSYSSGLARLSNCNNNSLLSRQTIAVYSATRQPRSPGVRSQVERAGRNSQSPTLESRGPFSKLH